LKVIISSFAISAVIPGEIVITLEPVFIAVITVPEVIPGITSTSVPTKSPETDVRDTVEFGNLALALNVVEIVQVDTLGEVAYAACVEAEDEAPATTVFIAVFIERVLEDALANVKASAGSSPVGDKEIAPTRAAMETDLLLINIVTISIPL